MYSDFEQGDLPSENLKSLLALRAFNEFIGSACYRPNPLVAFSSSLIVKQWHSPPL